MNLAELLSARLVAAPLNSAAPLLLDVLASSEGAGQTLSGRSNSEYSHLLSYTERSLWTSQ